MKDNQDWFPDFDEALKFSRLEGKGLLLQFHRDECTGCKKMYDITYQNPAVKKELFEWFVPLRLDILKDRVNRSKFSAFWTPSFYFINSRGNALYSQNGYFSPEDFRVFLRLGKAALDMPRGKYFSVIDLMDDGLIKFPVNPRAATMLFTRGMAEYLLGKEKSSFRGTMKEILEHYPESQEARMWPWRES